jgi:hypothetical protein
MSNIPIPPRVPIARRWRLIKYGVILVFLAIGYWYWHHAPVPDYLPVTSSWHAEAIQRTREESLFCPPAVYLRYRVTEPAASLAAKLIAAVAEVAPGRFEQKSREQIRQELESRYSEYPPQIRSHLDWPTLLANESGGVGAICTDRPFQVMDFRAQVRPSIDRRIVVRIIDMGPADSMLELWDTQTVDR